MFTKGIFINFTISAFQRCPGIAAYNPWCAYNFNYSCPLIPDENVLKVRISVGEKKLY